MNKNLKVAFVILHYQNIEVTKESTEYLKKVRGIEKHDIVIVDNASPNGSGQLLFKLYEKISNIHVLLNSQNGGFAYGNNIGYSYAQQQLRANIIVVMNSDVNIKDEAFIEKVINYTNTNKKVDILAPDIIVKNGFHQNPYMLKPISSINQKKLILRKEIGYFLYGLPIVGNLLINRRSLQCYQPNKIYKEVNIKINIIPHGACIVYLPGWTGNESFAFIDGTFLFVEEELLFDYCQKKGYVICYDPNFVVYHMEDASQNLVNKTSLQKKRNQIKYEIASRKLLLKKRTLIKKGYKA